MSEARIYYDEMLKLREQNDRLRKALYAIENTPPANIQNQVAASEQWWKRLVTDIRNQARRALQENRDD